jgi:alkylation response protein AidB-like acyl-CoA dehydrogenase
MFLAPDGDETEIANAAAQFLGEAMPIERLHASDPADMSTTLRGQLGEMGWFGLALPEQSGGSGLSAVEHALFFRQVGRLCGPVDLIAQSLAAFVVDDEVLRQALVSGQQGVALAAKDGERIRLLGPADATFALLVDRTDARLFARDAFAPQVRPSLDPATSMQLTDPAASLALAAVEGPEVWQLGQLGVAAMLVGIAETALDLIVEYAKVRETFGRKIGAYQAVRHPCADMALRVEAARCQLWFAAAALKEGRDDAHVHLDAAKHLANQAAVANADTNIQLHGGIGVTDEHHAHLLLKHGLLLSKLFGSKRALLAQLLDARVND